MLIPRAEVRIQEFHRHSHEILNSKHLPFCPWNCHYNSIGRILNSKCQISKNFNQKTGFRVWNSDFRTFAHGIAMEIPRAEIQNLELCCYGY